MAYRDVSVVLKDVHLTLRVEEGVDLDDVVSGLDIRAEGDDAEVINTEIGDWKVEDLAVTPAERRRRSGRPTGDSEALPPQRPLHRSMRHDFENAGQPP
ncbi:MAG: hypothetical protein NTV86_04445 [Planctomycetota bacterium]|nr:hypothetical protein [Planctomycetota bacterium]